MTNTRTILIIGGFALAGVTIVAVSKGINNAEGNVGQGVADGIRTLSDAIATDIRGIGLGAGIAAVGLLLPPPLDILAILAGAAVAAITILPGATGNGQTGNVTVVPGDSGGNHVEDDLGE